MIHSRRAAPGHFQNPGEFHEHNRRGRESHHRDPASHDNTWHRPFTTLELAALQSIIDPEEWFAPGGPGWTAPFVMEGASDQRWREGIGNAVPRKAGKAIGTVMGQTILMSRMGETFTLSAQPVWVRPIALALTMPEASA